MILDSLILEVTRRCNMACRHCLRGDARNVDMSPAVVDAALSGVSQIGYLTFTGGEPTLNLPIIHYITRYIREHGIPLTAFTLVTNGKEPSMEVVKAMRSLYAMAKRRRDCGLHWSNDPYHVGTVEPAIYKDLPFYARHMEDIDLQNYSNSTLINEGRAHKNRLSGHARDGKEILRIEYCGDEESLRALSTVYVAANGNVIQDCDLSFERIDRERLGNVLRTPLSRIISMGADYTYASEAA